MIRPLIAQNLRYLTKKEQFLQGEKTVWAAGEDDLLGYYLKDINSKGEHDFIVPENASHVYIGEGFWNSFASSSQRKRQVRADKVSYLWDMLIERFNEHILGGTQYYTTHPSVEHAEQVVRYLAREPRTRRRMLARSLLLILETTPSSMRRTHIIQPSGE